MTNWFKIKLEMPIWLLLKYTQGIYYQERTCIISEKKKKKYVLIISLIMIFLPYFRKILMIWVALIDIELFKACFE